MTFAYVFVEMFGCSIRSNWVGNIWLKIKGRVDESKGDKQIEICLLPGLEACWTRGCLL